MKKIIKHTSLFLVLSLLLVSVSVLNGCGSKEKFQKNSSSVGPKLSVIVPVYNTEEYLPACIDSLLNQTYKNLEVICVNDGSKDNSLSILNQYKEKDNRVVVIDKQNGGVSSARNVGISAATGDYISFLDSDDYIDLDAYESCMDKIVNTNADILTFGYTQEPSKSVYIPLEDKTYDPIECLKNELEQNCTVTNKIIKRSIFVDNDIRFAEDVAYGEDDLLIKMLLPHSKVVIGNPKPYYHYVQRESSAESTYTNEKRLVSAVNRCKHFAEYYVANDYKDLYSWALGSCLSITYYRINDLEDTQKKQQYSKNVLDILDNSLLKHVDSISKENSDMIDQLREYANI